MIPEKPEPKSLHVVVHFRGDHGQHLLRTADLPGLDIDGVQGLMEKVARNGGLIANSAGEDRSLLCWVPYHRVTRIEIGSSR